MTHGYELKEITSITANSRNTRRYLNRNRPEATRDNNKRQADKTRQTDRQTDRQTTRTPAA